MSTLARSSGQRLLVAALLLAGLAGCVVNPVPTPGSTTNTPPFESNDSDQRAKDASGRNFDGTSDAASGASDDTLDPAGAVTGTDATGDDAMDDDGTDGGVQIDGGVGDASVAD